MRIKSVEAVDLLGGKHDHSNGDHSGYDVGAKARHQDADRHAGMMNDLADQSRDDQRIKLALRRVTIHDFSRNRCGRLGSRGLR
jgi:hypothetical protein